MLVVILESKLHRSTAKKWINTLERDSFPSLESFINFLTNEAIWSNTMCINNIKRDPNGRYIARLPFIKGDRTLGDSRAAAYRRFHALENKFLSKPELKPEYHKVMQEYLELGHMSPVSDNSEHKYYLPHHTVIKKSSSTTKVRVVFDASAKSNNNKSLNDILMTGPTIQNTIFNQLLKFHSHKYVLTADIEKMYRQILLHKDNRAYQRILWRVGDQIKTFESNTVTFGVTSSPFLAIRTIHQLADDEANHFPRAAHILKNDLYVDDLLTGASNISETRQLRDKIVKLLKHGQFNIRQWASNEPKLIADLSNVNVNSNFLLDKNCTLKTLGISWEAKFDVIKYSVKSIVMPEKITKRNILSEIARIYDPLGLVGPVVLHAKKIMQEIWQAKVDWDESVPIHIYTSWQIFVDELKYLNNISFDRHILTDISCDVQVHGFCDASNIGYGACLFIRTTLADQSIHCRLLCAKSRVAPIKQITIPRLELCGAQVLTQLYKEASSSFNFLPSKIIFWCDSTVGLHWLKTPPNLLNVYVANRVANIQELSEKACWRHVKSEDNPADALSRGQLPQALVANKQWSFGPSWLQEVEAQWPEPIEILDKTTLEYKKNVCLIISEQHFSIINTLIKNCSTYQKLLRTYAYVRRFILALKIRCSKTDDKSSEILQNKFLSSQEIAQAEHELLIWIQGVYFETEIKIFSSQILSKNTRFNNLCPFLDEKGLLRVGGRLKRAKISYNQKHPILLPSKNYFTDLIIKDIHFRQLHSGIQTTLNAMRQRFWVLDGRNQVRQVIRKCMTCFRFIAEAEKFKMADLPENRVNARNLFKNVGIDYCGPFFIKEKKFRNTTKIKIYVCVFVCMSVKAVHLEVVSDLTTDGFLGALRRFIARRGTPVKIYSDNGTNFIGAKNQLKELYNLLNSDEHKHLVHNFTASHIPRISWNFIPPLSPHQGGLWESTVKLFKHHLKRVVGESLFTYEVFTTFTTEVEGILNSRPLTQMSSDPNDLNVLTPAHILIGEPIRNLPEQDYTDTPTNRLSFWEHITKMKQHFWARWHIEY
ncbi:uncharacterized protein LOC122852058 [Aphidius gifuensis]|uniref:uncharacterized protein LOC122852058 n=1 Tax=Aphidius gifuensis TaxID=684658 RepID=UPI001CDC2826|nr:uncharacterized protein LOC122852058 [Aphidius gifuensis]